jgi:hypothetical protein
MKRQFHILNNLLVHHRIFWNATECTDYASNSFLQRKLKKMQQYQNFIIPYFKWSPTCFGLHIAHHQEPKTAEVAFGFTYVESCRTCCCWTLSGSINQRLLLHTHTHTAHHQEPETALAASGFAYVEGCRTCSCWTLSTSNNCTSDNLLRMQNQRLLVQF